MASEVPISELKKSLSPPPRINGKGDSSSSKRRRRYRRCKSAPLADTAPREITNGIHEPKSPPSSKSFFLNKIHPSFRKVVIFLIIYVAFGTACFYIVMDQVKGKRVDRLLDSVYFTIVTMTTVGYGDLVPNSPTTKLLAVAFVFSGMAFIGLILSKAADYLVEKQEMLIIRAMHMNQALGPSEMNREMETKGIKYKLFMAVTLLVVYMLVGTIFLGAVEKLDWVDSFYCVVATITTLGYGDKSFSTKGGRVFAIFWILTGTLCVIQFYAYLTEFNTERKQKELVKMVLTKRMTNVDLEAADLDDDGLVTPAEFIVYKLKEMGKINQEDVYRLMDEFERLDVDQTGTLSAADLALAQSMPKHPSSSTQDS